MFTIKRSLFTKILLSMLIATTVPFMISSYISFQIIGRSVKEQLVQFNQKSMAITLSSIHKYFHNISLLGLSYYGDPALMRLLTKEEVQNPAESVYIKQKIQEIYANYPEIRSIAYKSALTNKQFNAKSELYNRLILPEFINRQWTANDPLFNQEYAVVNTNDERKLLINKYFTDIYTRDVLGLTSVTVKNSTLKELIDPLSTSEDSDIYILIQDELLYSTRGNEERPAWVDQLKKETSLSQDITQGIINDDKGIFIYYKKVSYNQPVTLIKFIPNSVIDKAGKEALNKSLKVQIAVMIFVSIMAGLISYFILHRVKRIFKFIKNVQMGDFKIKLESKAKDELGLLEDRFQYMVTELDVLLNQQYRYQLEVSTAQLKMLQAQINPHFLYNTLQSIGTLAIKKSAYEVSDKLAELGAMFRYNMDIDQEEVRLEDELEHLGHYISLQAGRFQSKLRFSQSIDEETLSIHVPKMILQPLVENSIVHGIERGNGFGEISVVIELKDKLLISVIDNGRGFDEETIRELRSLYAESFISKEPRGGIGLINVLKRFHIYFGPDFEWHIESIPFVQTTVALLIPYQSEKEGNNRESADRR